MKTTFSQINEGWNAEPNAPMPEIQIEENDLVLKFIVNHQMYSEFKEEDIGILRFVCVERYRLGSTNDEGWYRGQCRFSKIAPAWGEFYLVQGDAALLDAPIDWHPISTPSGKGNHYLFYFRDETFECIADRCIIEMTTLNSLYRTGKILRLPSSPIR